MAAGYMKPVDCLSEEERSEHLFLFTTNTSKLNYIFLCFLTGINVIHLPTLMSSKKEVSYRHKLRILPLHMPSENLVKWGRLLTFDQY
mmetsp:Transcript_24636/g.45920  ORF Transcript_24636/g.45920 Transcript_24636/m.45920 type:complete len:88 (+) Transcript_24636:336-599(+)